MEAVTAFVEGPLCFVIVYGLLYRKPWTAALQMLVSFGQLYGDVLYFATSLLEGTGSWFRGSLFAICSQASREPERRDCPNAQGWCTRGQSGSTPGFIS